jgi:tetratricopeptide (TPR) repeat protein
MPIPDRPRRLKLNVRALVVVLTVVGIGLIGTTWLWFARGEGGSAFLEYGRSLHEQGRDDLALQYLFAYLEERPRDLEALTLTGQLLTERAWSIRDLERAIGLYERILRIEPDPRSARALEARRHLVRLHLSVGPYLSRMLTRYRTADILAAQLLELGGPDPAALRLRGLVKLQLSAPGDDRELAESIALFEQARALEPGEVEGALPLARTYRDHQQDLPRALDVVDTMVQANDSLEARLKRYQFLDETARDLLSRGDSKRASELDARAERALEDLLEREPKGETVVLAAAERAIRQGRLGEAGGLLDRLPSDSRKVGRGCVVSGLLALREGRDDDAVAIWREGLLASRGSDAELTWWLAFAQLERGRPEEAHDLIDQYRRLIGGPKPNAAYLFLDGLSALTSNRPKEAIRILDSAKLHALPDLEAPIFLAMARAHRSIRNEAVALDLWGGRSESASGRDRPTSAPGRS